MPAKAPSGELLVHGTCVAIAGHAVLLRGAPGSGKSDLALRFISAFGHGRQYKKPAMLISDDQVLLTREGETLVARAPDAIAGQLEVRGIGIVRTERADNAILALIVDMVSANDMPRLPPEPLPREQILGLPVPVLKLHPFEASCPDKLKLALTGGL